MIFNRKTKTNIFLNCKATDRYNLVLIFEHFEGRQVSIANIRIFCGNLQNNFGYNSITFSQISHKIS